MTIKEINNWANYRISKSADYKNEYIVKLNKIASDNGVEPDAEEHPIRTINNLIKAGVESCVIESAIALYGCMNYYDGIEETFYSVKYRTEH